MKYRIFAVLAIFSFLAAAALPVTGVSAQAYTTSFTTAVTYMNIGDDTAQVSFTFYPTETSTGVPVSRPDLPKNAVTSLNVGSLTEVTSGFKGSAVISSNKPLAATMVQLPSSTVVKNRPLSNGFTAGFPSVRIPTALKGVADSNTIFSVQNVDSAAADLTVNFYDANNPTAAPVVVTANNIPAYSTKYFDLAAMSEIPAGFTGSATVLSKQHGTTTDGAVVASVLELNITGRGASSFEGTSSGATTIYMPSALCSYNGTNTYYAVQNIGTADATVKVTFSNGNFVEKTISQGAKKSFAGCEAGNPAGFIGSATITSVGADIVAMGKVAGTGLSTAFLGVPSGASTVALPYVRYTSAHWSDGTRQRAFIAVQNVGGAALNAGDVTITYLDKNGATVGTPQALPALAIGGKTSHNPSMLGEAGAEFGAYADGTYGGGAVVTGPAGSQLAVVVRIVTYSPAIPETVGEDYNGIAVASTLAQ